MQKLRLQTLLPVTVFLWLISPSFYGFWQEASPVASTLLPPLSLGQRVMLAPQLILDQMAYWFWPLGREPMTATLEPDSVMRQGLFFWLILVIVLRFCWRLRRVEKVIFWGPLTAMLLLVPFSGVIPEWTQPFNPLPLLPAGLALAGTVAIVFIRGLQDGFQTTEKLNPYVRHAARATALVVIIWIGCISVNLIAVMGRSWSERLAAIRPESGSVDLIVGVEFLRHELGTSPDMVESQLIRLGQGAPWYAEIPVVKAELLIAQGQPAAARVHLEHALKLAPGHQRALALMEDVKRSPAIPTHPELNPERDGEQAE